VSKPKPLSPNEIKGIVDVLGKWIDESGIESIVKKS
jgi:hypothetical protein